VKTPDFQFLRTEPVALKRYLPVFLYLSPEFKAIQDALGKEHERQRQAQIDVAKQFHAETATWGMASWERMLGINVDTSVDLETRRASVLAKMGKPPTVNPAFLTRMINLFTTVAATQIVEHPSEYTVDIYLPDSGTHDFTKIDEAVNTYLPAHLGHTYHFKTHLDASEYIGTVIRMASRGVECGLLANDEVLQTAVLWSVDTPVFEIKDDAVHVTELGLKMNSVFSASTKEVTPCSSAPIGATDGIFYVSGDGSVKQKLGSPATFTRASTAVLGGRTYQANEPRFMDDMLLLIQNESGKALEQLSIAEWVVNKPEWTMELEIKFVREFKNWEWTPFFAYSDYDPSNPYANAFRLEINRAGEAVCKGEGVGDLSYTVLTLNSVYKMAVTWKEGIVSVYRNGIQTSKDYAIEKDPRPKTLSGILFGFGGTNGFNGCIKNFRFSSTVHTAEKIAADSKLDELPVEDDTVLYMPLKQDLSMYGHYND